MSAPELQRANLGLLVATALVLAGGFAIVLGPGRGALDDAWRGQLARFQRPDDLERNEWGAVWSELLARTRPAADDSALVAHVTEDFRAAGARDLRVHPVELEPGVELETLDLRSSIDGQALSVTAVPVSVEFRASPEATMRILRLLDAGDLPARLEALELRRDLPAVAARMDLEYIVRRELAP